jgi:hypothetical protein
MVISIQSGSTTAMFRAVSYSIVDNIWIIICNNLMRKQEGLKGRSYEKSL